MIFEHTTGALVEVDMAQRITACTQGGGFARSMPLDVFLLTFKPVLNPRPYTGGHFCIDAGPYFTGYVNGNKWNGWAMPLFEHDEVLKMQGESGGLEYDAEKDTWTSTFDDDPETWERTNLILGDGTIVSGFWLGAGSWCWDADPT